MSLLASLAAAEPPRIASSHLSLGSASVPASSTSTPTAKSTSRGSRSHTRSSRRGPRSGSAEPRSSRTRRPRRASQERTRSSTRSRARASSAEPGPRKPHLQLHLRSSSSSSSSSSTSAYAYASSPQRPSSIRRRGSGATRGSASYSDVGSVSSRGSSGAVVRRRHNGGSSGGGRQSSTPSSPATGATGSSDYGSQEANAQANLQHWRQLLGDTEAQLRDARLKLARSDEESRTLKTKADSLVSMVQELMANVEAPRPASDPLMKALDRKAVSDLRRRIDSTTEALSRLVGSSSTADSHSHSLKGTAVHFGEYHAPDLSDDRLRAGRSPAVALAAGHAHDSVDSASLDSLIQQKMDSILSSSSSTLHSRPKATPSSAPSTASSDSMFSPPSRVSSSSSSSSTSSPYSSAAASVAAPPPPPPASRASASPVASSIPHGAVSSSRASSLAYSQSSNAEPTGPPTMRGLLRQSLSTNSIRSVDTSAGLRAAANAVASPRTPTSAPPAYAVPVVPPPAPTGSPSTSTSIPLPRRRPPPPTSTPPPLPQEGDGGPASELATHRRLGDRNPNLPLDVPITRSPQQPSHASASSSSLPKNPATARDVLLFRMARNDVSTNTQRVLSTGPDSKKFRAPAPKPVDVSDMIPGAKVDVGGAMTELEFRHSASTRAKEAAGRRCPTTPPLASDTSPPPAVPSIADRLENFSGPLNLPTHATLRNLGYAESGGDSASVRSGSPSSIRVGRRTLDIGEGSHIALSPRGDLVRSPSMQLKKQKSERMLKTYHGFKETGAALSVDQKRAVRIRQQQAASKFVQRKAVTVPSAAISEAHVNRALFKRTVV